MDLRQEFCAAAAAAVEDKQQENFCITHEIFTLDFLF